MSARRLGGYASYWAARSRLLLDGAVPVDAIDASRLPAGRHAAEVVRSDWANRGRRVTLRGRGGRTVVAILDPAPALGLHLEVQVEYPALAELLRTTEGSIVAVRGGEIIGEYDDVAAARRAHPTSAPRVTIM